MGATGLLADAVSTAQSFVWAFVGVYTLLIFAHILLAWFRQLPYSFQPVQRFLFDVCEPYLRLFRRVLPPIGVVDVSPIVAIVALQLLRWLIDSVLLERLH